MRRSLSESDRSAVHSFIGMDEGRGTKVPEVTGARPETARSNPGQGEASRKRRGGPLPVLGYNRSGDPGLGVKSQSRAVIAGSSRNASQRSPAGDR